MARASIGTSAHPALGPLPGGIADARPVVASAVPTAAFRARARVTRRRPVPCVIAGTDTGGCVANAMIGASVRAGFNLHVAYVAAPSVGAVTHSHIATPVARTVRRRAAQVVSLFARLAEVSRRAKAFSVVALADVRALQRTLELDHPTAVFTLPSFTAHARAVVALTLSRRAAVAELRAAAVEKRARRPREPCVTSA